MAAGQRYYWYVAPAASDIRNFPINLHLLVVNHLDPVNINYVQLFDSAAAVAPGAIPAIEITVFPSGIASYAPAMDGRKFNTGLAIYLSSTPGLLTPVAGNNISLFGEARQP